MAAAAADSWAAHTTGRGMQGSKQAARPHTDYTPHQTTHTTPHLNHALHHTRAGADRAPPPPPNHHHRRRPPATGRLVNDSRQPTDNSGVASFDEELQAGRFNLRKHQCSNYSLNHGHCVESPNESIQADSTHKQSEFHNIVRSRYALGKPCRYW